MSYAEISTIPPLDSDEIQQAFDQILTSGSHIRTQDPKEFKRLLANSVQSLVIGERFLRVSQD